MPVLGIETSCDETAVALVHRGKFLGQELASQADLHSLFGGVVPEIASREHLRLLPRLFRALMESTSTDPKDLDGVAVARGPGLLGGLLVGVSFAKGLCLSTGAPLVGVDHLKAHVLAPSMAEELPYPFLGMLISGGHTHLYRVDSSMEFTLLGRTLDDAAGEAFDKAAKALNLPYPGGRLVDELGQGSEPDRGLLPLPYVDNDNLDFSFSGLKTAVAQVIAGNPELRLRRFDPAFRTGREGVPDSGDPEGLAVLCATLNHVVARALVIKAGRALDRQRGLRGIVLSGGVAANSAIRSAFGELAEKRGLALVVPAPDLCTDNAVMISNLGEMTLEAGLMSTLDMEAVPRGRRLPEDHAPLRRDRV